jgi:glycosyltransferase involved in cell wall biosynthesis
MKILELCLSPDYGGLEMHMRDFSRWLSQRPDIQLFLCFQENSRIHQDLQNLNLPSLKFSGKAGKFPWKKALQLRWFIEQNEIEVVHVHWKFDLPLVALTKRLSRKKFRFVHTRQMNMPGRKKDFYHRFIYGSMDRFVAITKYIERQAAENLPLPPERITQVYYGVKIPDGLSPKKTEVLKKELGIEGEFSVGLLGRLSEYKGQHLLIEAVEMLKREGIRIDAWIVGASFEPAYKEKLQDMVDEKQIADRIHFMDFYPDPITLMSCFDTVVLTTKNETFGLVLIEAMHAGVAVIGSDAGGVPEIIDHGETGLLFETWNASALANAIQVLFDDENLRRQMATTGQEKARNKFDLENQYQNFLDTLK